MFEVIIPIVAMIILERIAHYQSTALADRLIEVELTLAVHQCLIEQYGAAHDEE